MSENEKTDAIVPAKETVPVLVYDRDDPTSLYMNPGIFNQLQRVATLMASSGLVPSHLRGEDKVADCFLVASQAIRWGMDPFSAAQHIYVVHGRVGWEGKIVAAIVNRHLNKKLNYEYTGKENTPERTVVVSGTLRGETKARTVKGSIKDWSTKNEQWKSGDQMLAYRGAREWARRHMPEAVLGVYSDDEVREIAMREAEEVNDDALDELLDPAKVTEADDPGNETPPPAPGRKTAKETQAEQDEEPEPEPKPKKAPPKKKAAKPKPAPKPKPKPEPEPEEEDVDEDEIDALFS